MLPRLSLIFPLTTPVPAQHKRRMQTRIPREFDIAISIADHPACTHIDLKILHRAINQPRFRFTTITIKAVRRLTDRWMMRAVIDRVELRVLQITLELIVNARDHLFSEVPARYASLVRDHDRQQAIVVQDPDGLG